MEEKIETIRIDLGRVIEKGEGLFIPNIIFDQFAEIDIYKNCVPDLICLVPEKER